MEKQMLINKLKDIVGTDHVLHSEMDLTLYGYDAYLEKGKPDVVVLPNSTEEVSKVVRLAHEEKVPIIGRGSGTNLSGGTIPTGEPVVNRQIDHFSRELPPNARLVPRGQFVADDDEAPVAGDAASVAKSALKPAAKKNRK